MHQKTAWLAIFYMCIPAGYAVGYVFGGLVSCPPILIPSLNLQIRTVEESIFLYLSKLPVNKQVGNHYGWRWAFWVESILMVPFVIMGFVMKPLNMKGANLSCINFCVTIVHF